MNPFARYTLLRILLFGVVIGVLAAVGVDGLVLLVGSVLVSAALSYLLLSGPRTALVQRLEQRASTRAARVAPDRDSLAEDAQIDAAQAAAPQAAAPKGAAPTATARRGGPARGGRSGVS